MKESGADFVDIKSGGVDIVAETSSYLAGETAWRFWGGGQ